MVNVQMDMPEEKGEYICDVQKKKVRIKKAKVYEIEEYDWRNSDND